MRVTVKSGMTGKYAQAYILVVPFLLCFKKAELLQTVEKRAAIDRPGRTGGRRYDSDMERNSVFPDFVWGKSDSG